MPEPITNRHLTRTSPSEHNQVRTCAQCLGRALYRLCWHWAGRDRHQLACGVHGIRWANRFHLDLPGPADPRPADRVTRRAPRPMLPVRATRQLPLPVLLSSVPGYHDTPAPAAATVDDEAVRVLGMIADGLTDETITQRLGFSTRRRVILAVAAAIGRVDATNRPHAVHLAHTKGLLCEPARAGDIGITLGDTEHQVLVMLAAGCTRPQIAADIGTSIGTVANRVNKLKAVFGQGSAARAVHQAHLLGVLPCACTRPSTQEVTT